MYGGIPVLTIDQVAFEREPRTCGDAGILYRHEL